MPAKRYHWSGFISGSRGKRQGKWPAVPAVQHLEARTFLSAVFESDGSAPPIQADFSWSMADRYGLDLNRNGLIDLPNSKSYVNPSAYVVKLDASSTASPLAVTAYRWTISGAGLSVPLVGSGQKLSARIPKLGEYTVNLEVEDSAGGKATCSQSILAKDVVIVQLGDSYASGEGNPEVPASKPRFVRWADGYTRAGSKQTGAETKQTKAMTRENLEAHRSTLCASSQAALALERSDPHFSVTYINLAQSGATIEEGLLSGKDGSVTDTYELPGQISELQGLLGVGKASQSRRIDFLSLSIGGNDIDFTGIIDDLLGFTKSNKSILKAFESKLKHLKADYTSLAKVLSRQFNVAHTLITAYPDMTRDEHGRYCEFADDVQFPWYISDSGAEFASTRILGPLNRAIAAANKATWQYVGGFLPEFVTHGYAASVPWFRTMSKARAMQGSETKAASLIPLSCGAFHPNELGHRSISKYLLSAIESEMT
jgi:hypothetical protein